MRNRKLLSLTAGIVLILIAFPGISSADDAASLKAQIEAFPYFEVEIVEPNIVQVSGGGDGTDTISLNIDEGVTVRWCAQYESLADPVIKYEGLGTFEVGPGGYIYNMGSGDTIAASGMKVVVRGTGDLMADMGIVEAHNGSAIHATGQNTVVEVKEFGVVSGTTTQGGIHPVIYMNNTLNIGDNVLVSGGRVLGLTANTSYSGTVTIHTSGNVIMTDGEVFTNVTRGYAICLFGNGTAEIEGGKVWTSGDNSTAIGTSLAARNLVEFASVKITGGTVTATGGGHTIRMAGKNSKITVSGGVVSAIGGGNAIRSEGTSATNVTITVEGGFVYAQSIYADLLTETVINRIGGGTTNITAPGVVAGWKPPRIGSPPYPYVEGDNKNLSVFPAGTAVWHNETGSVGVDGILYDGMYFYPVNDVMVNNDFGLIFDAGSGKMYLDTAKNGMIASNPEYEIGKGTPVDGITYTWDGTINRLDLTNFNWNTSQPVALRILNGSEKLTLHLTGNNSFISHNGTGQTNGIISTVPIEIEGGGLLDAIAEGGVSGNSVGIDCAEITIKSGTVTAYGDTTAYTGTIHTPDSYTYRTNSTDNHPDTGKLWYPGSSETEYKDDLKDKYTQITSEEISVISDIVVSGVVKTALSDTDTVTIKLYGDTMKAALIDANVSAWFTDLPDGVTVTANAAAGADIITLTFSGTPTATSAAVFKINIPADNLTGNKNITVQPNIDAKFDIEGASSNGGGTGTGKAAVVPKTELPADSENGNNNPNSGGKNDSDGLNPTNETENEPTQEGNQSYISLILFILLSIALFVYRRYEEREE